MKINLAMIFGGESVEHEISIISAIQAMENIDTEKYNIIPIYISKSGKMYSHEKFKTIEEFKNFDESEYKPINIEFDKESVVMMRRSLFSKEVIKIDVFFPIVHGTNSEDGTIQGYLKMFNLPIVGPTVLSGAIGQDKAVAKDLLKAHNISQVPYIWLNNNCSIEENAQVIREEIGLPVIIKPAKLGSSVGIELVREDHQLVPALESAFSYDSKVVVEQLLSNFDDYNISVIGNYRQMELSNIERVVKEEEFLSFSQKYMSGSKKGSNDIQSQGMASLSRELPAKLSPEIKAEMEKLAQEAFTVLNCNGVVRFDLIKTENDEVYVNEVNSIPGSLSYYFWEEKGIKYEDLLDKLITLAVNDFYKNKKLQYSFETNVLNMHAKGMKK